MRHFKLYGKVNISELRNEVKNVHKLAEQSEVFLNMLCQCNIDSMK